MSIKKGSVNVVDRYKGAQLVEQVRKGTDLIFDPYTEITGYLPLIFKSRATVALKNYRIHGTSEGAGVETGNLFNWKKVKLNTGVAWVTGEEVQNDGCNLSDYIPVEAADYTASFNVYFLFYDEQKEYVGRYDGSSFAKTGGVETFSKIPIPYTGYIRILTLRAIDDLKTFMFVKNSPLPETYIPYGYKIPILNTSGNLWNGEIEQGGINSGGSLVESAMRVRSCITNLVGGQTYFIKSNQNIRMIYAYYGMWTDTKIGLVLDNNTYKTEYTFKLPEGANSIGVALMTYPETNIVPSDVTTAILANSSNYDLFISSTKLGKEEYVDFGEQKVYKRTAQLFDYKTMAPISERGKYLKQNGDTQNATSWAVTDYIPLNDTSITLSLMSNIGSAPSLCVYDQNKSYLDGMEYNGQSTKKLNITGAAYARFSYIWDNTAPATSTIDKIMLNSGSTAEPFAPYYNPTDPPVPLPPIPTYKDENTLSSTETLGEVTVKGRIRELNYRRIEYLKSTGTQYIQTDIVPTNTTKTVLDVEFGTWKLTTHSDPERGLIGTESLSPENKNTEIYKINLLGTTNSSDDRAFTFYAGYGWHAGIDCYLYNPAIPSRNILILQSNMGSWGSASISLTEAKTLREPTLPMLIFGNARLYEATGSIVRSPFKMTNMSLYSCKIYDSGNALSHNLVPVEREDGELGLLDTMTNKFYANAGTGTFEKGEYI